jgi:peroxiredoxin
VVISLASLPAFAALKAGDPAPEFNAQASLNGKAFQYSLKNALKKGPVVVYFFPAAYTSGCNIQAHTFSINADKFKAAGATIVGVSLDSIERLNDFSKDPNYCSGKFPTASDPDGAIAKSFELSIRDARLARRTPVVRKSTTVLPSARPSSSHRTTRSSRRSVASPRLITSRRRSQPFRI